MRILTTYHPEHLIFNGIVAALTAIEKDLVSWRPHTKPAFDAFDEMRPELFICLASDITQDVPLPLQQYQTPAIVFNDKPTYFSTFDNINVKIVCTNGSEHPAGDPIWHRVQPAANVAQFNNGHHNDKYACDVLYVSNTHLSPEHSAMLGKLQNKSYTTRVCGPVRVNLTNYVGNCSIKTLTDMIASSKIVIDIDHNILYDAAFNNTFCLTNIQNDVFASYNSEEDLVDKIDHFLTEEKHRKAHIKKAKKAVENHTYFHCVSDMCYILNLPELSKKSMQILDQLS